MANIVSNWMNLNELRKFPVDERYPCDIPDDFISDMQVFVPAPRNQHVEEGGPIVNISQTAPSSGFPYIISAAATKYLVTVVVKCQGCTLFCTKSRDSIVPYSPVEFVSENGACSGWVSFGALDPSVTFSFTDGTIDKGRLDWRAVVFYPSSTIGGLSIPALSSKISGDIKIVAGSGMSVSSNPDTNSLKLSLNQELKPMYMDPCFGESDGLGFPDICSINGLSADEGSIVLAFTGSKISKADAHRLQNDMKGYIGSSAAEYAEVSDYHDNTVFVDLSNSVFSNHSKVKMAIPNSDPSGLTIVDGNVTGQNCSITFTVSQGLKFTVGSHVFVHSLSDPDASAIEAVVQKVSGTPFHGVELGSNTAFRNMENVLVVLATRVGSDYTESEVREICTIATYGQAWAEATNVVGTITAGMPVILFDPASFITVSADAETTKISSTEYDDKIKVLVRSFGDNATFRIIGYRLVYDLVDPKSFGLSRRYLEFSTDSGYHFPEYDIYTRSDCLPPIAELYRNIKVVGPGDTPVWVADFTNFDRDEARAHGSEPSDPDEEHPEEYQIPYEKYHIKSNRYYIGTDDTHARVIKVITPDTSTIVDDLAKDPFMQFDSNTVLESSGGPDKPIIFSHRIRRSIAFSDIVGVYVEVAYRKLTNPADFVVRRPVRFHNT